MKVRIEKSKNKIKKFKTLEKRVFVNKNDQLIEKTITRVKLKGRIEFHSK